MPLASNGPSPGQEAVAAATKPPSPSLPVSAQGLSLAGSESDRQCRPSAMRRRSGDSAFPESGLVHVGLLANLNGPSPVCQASLPQPLVLVLAVPGTLGARAHGARRLSESRSSSVLVAAVVRWQAWTAPPSSLGSSRRLGWPRAAPVASLGELHLGWLPVPEVLSLPVAAVVSPA